MRFLKYPFSPLVFSICFHLSTLLRCYSKTHTFHAFPPIDHTETYPLNADGSDSIRPGFFVTVFKSLRFHLSILETERFQNAPPSYHDQEWTNQNARIYHNTNTTLPCNKSGILWFIFFFNMYVELVFVNLSFSYCRVVQFWTYLIAGKMMSKKKLRRDWEQCKLLIGQQLKTEQTKTFFLSFLIWFHMWLRRYLVWNESSFHSST